MEYPIPEYTTLILFAGLVGYAVYMMWRDS
jgi:hypothetical protein